MARKKSKRAVTKKAVAVKSSNKASLGLSIIALILNVVFVAGLGTLIAGKSKSGAWQLILFIVGAILVSLAYAYDIGVLYIGSPLMLAAWIWGLVSGIKLIQDCR